jgi:hypothetical protein
LKLVDRTQERDTFHRLIRLEDNARLLTLRDRGGQGKSSLLKKLQSDCLSRPTPVSLITLDTLRAHTPLAFVKKMREDLRVFQVSFTHFDELDGELRRRTLPTELPGFGDAIGTVHASGATVNAGGRIVGVELHVPSGPDSGWLSPDEATERTAQVIQAFFAELAEHCRERLVVVMVDGYEACGPDLAEWLLNYFLNWHCFQLDQRPAQLAVVVAGRTTPDCEGFLGPDRWKELVVTIPSLSQLESEHVRELFDERGVSPTDAQVEVVRDKLREGWSIKKALQLIDLFRGTDADE